MIQVKDIIKMLSENRGKCINYDNFSMQIYDNSNLQANIRYKGIAIIKIEQNLEKTLNFYLPREDDVEIIDYMKKCFLKENETIFEIYHSFKGHEYIEQAIAALLLLSAE